MTTGTHRDLVAWQEAMNLVEAVYQQTAGFPREETYVLTAQTHRAAISVPSNIAEGAARNSGRELYRHLGIAIGSLAELETQLELAIRLNYLPKNVDVFKQVRRVGRLVNALRNSCGVGLKRTDAIHALSVTPHQSRFTSDAPPVTPLERAC